jgi:hypothetical protein
MPAASTEPVFFVSKSQGGWDNREIGKGMRMYGNDTQCIVDPNSAIERPECLNIGNQTQLQQVLAAKTPLRTLTCGSEVANTSWGLTLINSARDPGGYYPSNWCVTVKTVLKNTGGLRDSMMRWKWFLRRSWARDAVQKRAALWPCVSPCALAAPVHHAGNANCSPGRGGPICAACPPGSVSPGGPDSTCTPCPAGSFLAAKQDRCYSGWPDASWGSGCDACNGVVLLGGVGKASSQGASEALLLSSCQKSPSASNLILCLQRAWRSSCLSASPRPAGTSVRPLGWVCACLATTPSALWTLAAPSNGPNASPSAIRPSCSRCWPQRSRSAQSRAAASMQTHCGASKMEARTLADITLPTGVWQSSHCSRTQVGSAPPRGLKVFVRKQQPVDRCSNTAPSCSLWPCALAAPVHHAGNANCSPGRGGPICAACPPGSVSPGGPDSTCTPCPAGSFLAAKQDRCYSEWQAAAARDLVPCRRHGCAQEGVCRSSHPSSFLELTAAALQSPQAEPAPPSSRSSPVISRPSPSPSPSNSLTSRSSPPPFSSTPLQSSSTSPTTSSQPSGGIIAGATVAAVAVLAAIAAAVVYARKRGEHGKTQGEAAVGTPALWTGTVGAPAPQPPPLELESGGVMLQPYPGIHRA